MSSGYAPCSGYVLQLTEDLLYKLGYDWRKEYVLFNNENQPDTGVDGTEIDVGVFVYRAENGDIYDGLEDEQTYISFSEEDLFVKTNTPVMDKLASLQIVPNFEMWVQFG